jgi:hypothetical protein
MKALFIEPSQSGISVAWYRVCFGSRRSLVQIQYARPQLTQNGSAPDERVKGLTRQLSLNKTPQVYDKIDVCLMALLKNMLPIGHKKLQRIVMQWTWSREFSKKKTHMRSLCRLDAL